MVERLDATKVDFVKTVEILKRDGFSWDIDGVEVASAVLSLKEYNLLHGFRLRNPKTLDDIKKYWIMVKWTYNWYLSKYGSGFDFGLIRIAESGRDINPGFKADEIQRIGVGYHFDDSFEDAERIARSGTTVVLVPQPWNLDYEPTDERIIKVEGYEHRFKMVRAFLTLAERLSNR